MNRPFGTIMYIYFIFTAGQSNSISSLIADYYISITFSIVVLIQGGRGHCTEQYNGTKYFHIPMLAFNAF